MGADQENLPANHDYIALLELCTAIAKTLDLPAFQHQAGFVFIFDEIVMACLAVYRNGAGVVFGF